MILKNAFKYWSKTLWYQFLASVMCFSIFSIVLYHFVTQFGLLEEYLKISKLLLTNPMEYNKQFMLLAVKKEVQYLTYILLLVSAALFPMNIGFYKIFRKIDQKEQPEFNDLFAGFLGLEFFKYFGYGLFWQMIAFYANATFVLGIVWVFITLFAAPLMFFQNKRIFEIIPLSIQALKSHFVPIFVAVMVSFLFKYFGLLTLVGFLFTFPFWNAMIYVLYQEYFAGTETESTISREE